MNKTSIEWCHRPETRGALGAMTWNPIRARRTDTDGTRTAKNGTGARRNVTGTFCTRISPGCTNCYASTINKRFGNGLEFTVPNLDKIEFFISEKILEEPLRQTKPCTIFVGDMFDLFHEAISTDLLLRVMTVVAGASQHTFQLLTKRAERMREFFKVTADVVGHPLPNVWLGVSVESQKYADERIPILLKTPAAVRFLSVEPMLEAVDLENLPSASGIGRYLDCLSNSGVDRGAEIPNKIDWVICGGESGHAARPMHPSWARSVRDQCIAASVPFFFKQWGEWQPHPNQPDPKGDYHGGIFLLPNGHWGNQGDWWEGRAHAMNRMGKKHAGAMLDGREWREFPTIREAVTA